MPGRKDAKKKVDGGIVKGVNDGMPYVCFQAEQDVIDRIDAVAAEAAPVEMSRSATIRLLIEIALQQIEATTLGTVCDALKKAGKPVVLKKARAKKVYLRKKRVA